MVPVKGSKEPVCVLILDADASARRVLAAALSRSLELVHDLYSFGELSEATACFTKAHLVIADLDMPGLGGIAGIPRLMAQCPQARLIALSSRGSVQAAVEAIRLGAADFLIKPVKPQHLAQRAGECLHMPIATRMNHKAQAPLHHAASADEAASAFEGFIGASQTMHRIYNQITRLAPSRAPVFITGESGTGKEVTAEAIHARSGRPGMPFIAINCSAIPKDLMESEIFGHVRGAFTGALDERPGAAELADGGTLFLDELCEMDIGLQAKLLRFIQTGIVRRVGDTKSRKVDVRFVCATNRDPQQEVRLGRLREDLYYRLHVLPIHLPPLRERREDVVPLAQAFLRRFASEEGRHAASFGAEAIAMLRSHDWPGNVRQLQNVIRRVVVLHDDPVIEAEHLAPALAITALDQTAGLMADAIGGTTQCNTARDGSEGGLIEPLWQQEKRIIENALSAFGGSIGRAAAALEISPSTIYRKKQEWTARACA